MSMSRKKNRTKMTLLLVPILIIILTLVEEKGFEKKIEKTLAGIEEEIIRTDVKNIVILKENEDYSILFINKNEENRKISNLKAIGKIEFNNLIRIYNGKFGYADTKGNIIIQMSYEEGYDFIDGIAVAKKDRYGIIDESGKEILPFIYDEIYIGKRKRVIIKRDNNYYISNLKDEKLLDIDFLFPIDEDKLIFERDSKFGIMNYSGKELIKNEYIEISREIGKNFIGKKGEKYSVYNLETKRKISNEYDYIEQIDKNIYKAGTIENGNYAFISQDFESKEIYDDIIKIKKEIVPNKIVYAGIGDNKIDLIDETGVIKSISEEEFQKMLE